MINAVGREIPDEILQKMKKPAFTGAYSPKKDVIIRTTAKSRCAAIEKGKTAESKLLVSIEDVIEKTGIKDGMTISFHHHMRNGDEVVNLVMEAIAKKGIKDIHIAASGLFQCHEPLVKLMEEDVVTGITVSTISPGPLAKAITNGKLKHPAVFMSHGGRPRAIEAGELHIDVAFISAPCCDAYGNMNGAYGKSACGVLSYAYADAQYADQVVAVTDNLVEFPACPIEISQEKVDYVVQVESIGNPEGISFGPTKPTTDPENLKIADMTAQLLNETGYIKNGMSMQTGAGGTSIAVAAAVRQIMKEKKIRGSFASGGITSYFVEMLKEDLFQGLLDVQCFDSVAIESCRDNPRHMPMSASQYANPNTKGCLVNQLDIMILGATEIDVDFNVNVVTGSNGVILSSSGGNNDCAAGAKIAVVVTNLVKRDMCILRERVTTVVTPGETVDVLVTEYGIAVNPKRTDLMKLLKHSQLPVMNIHELKAIGDQKATKIVKPQFTDKIVGIVEYRDGSVIDVVKKPIQEF